jgi:hypothetical protein
MITGLEHKSISNALNRAKLPEYWGQYFAYEKDAELLSLTTDALLQIITVAKSKDRPFIDSQIAINSILTELSKKHNFQRQFSERHPELHREQVLGMQLYKLLLEDTDVWVYHETQHSGHLFPHATYFQ